MNIKLVVAGDAFYYVYECDGKCEAGAGACDEVTLLDGTLLCGCTGSESWAEGASCYTSVVNGGSNYSDYTCHAYNCLPEPCELIPEVDITGDWQVTCTCTL